MKLTVFLPAMHPSKHHTGYLRQIAESFLRGSEKLHIITSRALELDTAYVHITNDVPSSLIQELQKLSSDETALILNEDVCGPVFDLDDLMARIQHVKDTAVELVRGSGLAVIHGKALTSTALNRWLQNLEDTSLLTAASSGELYNTAELRDVTEQPMLDEPAYLIDRLGFPFFSHKVFHRPYHNVLSTTLGQQSDELLKCLQRYAFDLNPLMDMLIHQEHQEDLLHGFHLHYTLSSSISPSDVSFASTDHFLALGMHLYYMDLIEQSRKYAQNFPPYTDIFITTSDEEKKKTIENAFRDVACHSLTVIVIGNRGRDVSSLLVGLAHLSDWQIVCFYHDKKTLQTKPGSIGVGFAYMLAENMFGSSQYVLNVIDLFLKNPRLGLACPPAPNHSDYYFTMGLPWGPNWNVTYDLYQRLNLSVPISQEKPPVAPLGTCFWFRGKALENLLQKGWCYEDFPPEPNGTDGTLLHAFERIYPYCVQEAGYFAAYIYSDRFAAMEITSYKHYIRGFNRVADHHSIINKVDEMISAVDDRWKD